MPSRWNDGGRGSPWGNGAKPGSEIEEIVRQGQARHGTRLTVHHTPKAGPCSSSWAPPYVFRREY